MKDVTECISLAQSAAVAGQKPHKIALLVLTYLQQRWPMHSPIILLECSLMKAFGIPLRVVRDIEEWRSVSDTGTLSDQDIDELLRPWVLQFLQRSNPS